ncbi:MAG: hypothetical protein H6729_00745 [Deltaproteobacteria bacterium]|nr:hypothetical protein [Deltaproteobacteria bacterium]
MNVALCAPARVHAQTEVETTDSDEDIRTTDANSDRVILFSTASTHPEGTFFFTDYEVILLQFGYAITDRLQVSLTGVPPMIKDQSYFFDLSAKYNVYRGPVFRAAAIGALTVITEDSGEAFFGGRLGGVGQFCFSVACRASISLNVIANIVADLDTVLPIALGAGLSYRLSDLFAIQLEPAYFVAVGTQKLEVDAPDGMLLSYGVRLSGREWGLDLSMLRPIAEDVADELILGVPWISFTYRR